MTNPMEILAAALTERVRHETEPVREAVLLVQTCCEDFTTTHSRAIERRVLGAMLRAAGTDGPEDDPALENATRSLLRAMEGLMAYLAPSPLATPPGPSPEPPAPPQGPPPAGPAPTDRARRADALVNALEPPAGDRLIGPPPEALPTMGPLPDPDQCSLLGHVHAVAPPMRVETAALDEALDELAAQEEQPVHSGVIEIPANASAEPDPADDSPCKSSCDCECEPPATLPGCNGQETPRSTVELEQMAARESGVQAKQFNADPADVKLAKETYLQARQIDFLFGGSDRTALIMQVCVAHCRLLMDRLPNNSAAHNDMTKTLKFLAAKKEMHKITPFILGLAHNQEYDWDLVANEAIAALRDYDRTAETAALVRPDPSKPPKKEPPRNSFTWPPLPRLRKCIALGREVIMVGGEVSEEKIRVIKDRFGIDVSWYETDPNRPRKAEDVVNRIRGGRVCAVIVINGWMRHKVYANIVAACNSMSIPFANGEKGGTGCIGNAIDKLEEALARMAAA